MIDAGTALSIGLVNTVVPADNLLDEAESIAKKIASKGPIAVRKAKSVINRGFDTDLQTGCSYEAEAFGECFTSGQPKEGMSAFLEKRTPKW
jgi:enoyl-CoA hydratase